MHKHGNIVLVHVNTHYQDMSPHFFYECQSLLHELISLESIRQQFNEHTAIGVIVKIEDYGFFTQDQLINS